MHQTMASIASLEKIEIIRSQRVYAEQSEAKIFEKKMIILEPITAILGPQFCRILVLGPHFWWSGGPGAPLDRPCIECGSEDLGGDFNLVMDLDLDKKGGQKITGENFQKLLHTYVEQNNLCDV